MGLSKYMYIILHSVILSYSTNSSFISLVALSKLLFGTIGSYPEFVTDKCKTINQAFD